MHPAVPMFAAVVPTFSSGTIDATGEKIAFSGFVFFQGRSSTKAIRNVEFLFGAVTKAGGSGLTVSLQDPTTSAGPPFQPDETQDQTVAIANADAGFDSNLWYTTGNLSADRTVAFGALLSVVIEFDGSGRLGADSVAIRGIASGNTGPAHFLAYSAKTASWAASSMIPDVILKFSDGTYGTLLGAFPCSAIGSLTYNSGSATDEYALEFDFPGPVAVDAGQGVWQHAAAGSDAELVVYDGTSAMANGTATLDGTQSATAGGNRMGFGCFGAALSLTENTTYRLALKPTTANNVVLHYFDVATAGHLQAHIGGEDWALTGRVNGGSWDAPTTTRRPFLWPMLAGLDDGAGGGGGVVGVIGE